MTLYHTLLPWMTDNEDELVIACGIEHGEIGGQGKRYRNGLLVDGPPVNCPECLEVVRKLDEGIDTYQRKY